VERIMTTPRIITTYETPSPVHPFVTIMSYAELYDMAEHIARLRANFLQQIDAMQPDAILERAEAADLEWRTREPDGSDTGMSAQLDEAGFGSGGVM
jgi:hypothetical protein